MSHPARGLVSEELRTHPGYRLRSELARSSLGDGREAWGRRWLTWLNTLCLLVLVVGLLGRRNPGRPAPSGTRDLPPPALPVLFQPAPSTARAADVSEAPVPVSPPAGASSPGPVSPVVVAAVGTVGIEFPVVVETTVTPTTDPLRAAPPVGAAAVEAVDAVPAGLPAGAGPGRPDPGPVVFIPGAAVGAGGSYPAPAYPREARLRGEQGEVRLRVTVGADGRAEEVGIESGSGSGILDRAAAAQVRRFWRWPPGRRREYIVPLEFRLD